MICFKDSLTAKICRHAITQGTNKIHLETGQPFQLFFEESRALSQQRINSTIEILLGTDVISLCQHIP